MNINEGAAFRKLTVLMFPLAALRITLGLCNSPSFLFSLFPPRKMHLFRLFAEREDVLALTKSPAGENTLS